MKKSRDYYVMDWSMNFTFDIFVLRQSEVLIETKNRQNLPVFFCFITLAELGASIQEILRLASRWLYKGVKMQQVYVAGT
jgi:hypothetical protein